MCTLDHFILFRFYLLDNKNIDNSHILYKYIGYINGFGSSDMRGGSGSHDPIVHERSITGDKLQQRSMLWEMDANIRSNQIHKGKLNNPKTEARPTNYDKEI